MKKSVALKEFQVRDMSTGLFDSGRTSGGRIVWSKRGKRWKTLGYVKLHFNTSVREPIRSTWEIVEYELTETSRFSAAIIVDNKKVVGL